MDISRRELFKMASVAAVGAAVGQFTTQSVEAAAHGKKILKLKAAPVVGSKNVTGQKFSGTAAKVYFTDKIDAPHLIKLYNKINGEIYGKVGIKLHTGEPQGPNILPREMVRAFQAQVPNSNIIETNTLYVGKRYTTEDHRATLATNGWNFCDVDIMDEDEGYVNFPVRGGFHLKEVAMGGHLANYDSIVVLTHFKGHAMGGFGGSLKNIAIGMASGHVGKVQVHGYDSKKFGMPPVNVDWFDGTFPLKENLMERMADSGKATCDYFGKRIVFLNVMRRMSVDCDCAGTRAAEPTMADVGILASTDILAIDQACCDLVWTATDSADLRERIESRHGLRQLSAMAELKMGNPQYELISVD
ncbi:MAG: DUF362 domain-containing protein [Selenomonadaceae bacterium]|nr:DUF362 domain-containing protein [Selenomonadaceae bacterium]